MSGASIFVDPINQFTIPNLFFFCYSLSYFSADSILFRSFSIAIVKSFSLITVILFSNGIMEYYLLDNFLFSVFFLKLSIIEK